MSPQCSHCHVNEREDRESKQWLVLPERGRYCDALSRPTRPEADYCGEDGRSRHLFASNSYHVVQHRRRPTYDDCSMLLRIDVTYITLRRKLASGLSYVLPRVTAP